MKIKRLTESFEDYSKYKVSSYYDYAKRGLEDDFETDDREEAKDKAWEFFQKGGVVVIENNYTGKETTLPDADMEYIEDGNEFLNDFFNEIDESYKKGLKESAMGEYSDKLYDIVDSLERSGLTEMCYSFIKWMSEDDCKDFYETYYNDEYLSESYSTLPITESERNDNIEFGKWKKMDKSTL